MFKGFLRGATGLTLAALLGACSGNRQAETAAKPTEPECVETYDNNKIWKQCFTAAQLTITNGITLLGEYELRAKQATGEISIGGQLCDESINHTDWDTEYRYGDLVIKANCVDAYRALLNPQGRI